MSDWQKHEEHDTICTALLDAFGKEYYCFDCEHFFVYEFSKEGTESDKECEHPSCEQNGEERVYRGHHFLLCKIHFDELKEEGE